MQVDLNLIVVLLLFRPKEYYPSIVSKICLNNQKQFLTSCLFLDVTIFRNTNTDDESCTDIFPSIIR